MRKYKLKTDQNWLKPILFVVVVGLFLLYFGDKGSRQPYFFSQGGYILSREKNSKYFWTCIAHHNPGINPNRFNGKVQKCEFLVPFSSKILENQKFVHDPQELEPS